MTVVRHDLNAQPTKIHATSSIQRSGCISVIFSMYRPFSRARPLDELRT